MNTMTETETETQPTDDNFVQPGGGQGECGGEGKQQQQAEPDKVGKMEAALADLATHVKTISTPQQTQKEPTPEEVAEFWGVYNPEKENPQFFDQFLRLMPDMDAEEKKKVIEAFRPVFGAMQKGMVRQAMIGAQRLIEKFQRDEFGPVKQHYTEAQAAAQKREFYDENPALEDDKFNPVLMAVAEQLSTQTFPSRKAYNKALAEGAAEQIKRLIPDFDLGQPKQAKQPATTPRLPRTSVGGSGGNGGGGADTKRSGDGNVSSAINW